MRSSLTPQQRKAAARRYLAGDTAQELAERYKCSVTTIYRYMPRLDEAEARKRRTDGIQARKAKGLRWGRPTHTDVVARREEIVGMREQGHSLREIANALGCSHEAVRRVLHTSAREDQTLAARARGIQHDYLTAPDAATELGIRRDTLHEYLVAGKFPGAFQIGSNGWWLIPRVSVEAYAEHRRARRPAAATPAQTSPRPGADAAGKQCSAEEVGIKAGC